MEIILGLDVGTTAVKCLAFDRCGKTLASAIQPVRLYTPAPAWVEQDPQELWQAVLQSCRKVVAALPSAGQIAALSLSAQGGTTIPVDAGGRPTHMAFSWMDERPVAQARAVEQALGREWVYQNTGWPLYPGLPLNHIAWFKENCPQEFRKTERFLFVNDFILSRLCGEYCMDPSDASITQLYNLAAGDWDGILLDRAGIDRQQLSPVGPSGEKIGQITPAASKLTGLPAGVPVVNGAHDQYCAALGTGITRPGPVLLSCGTAWVVLAVPASLEKALRAGLSVSRHAVNGIWGGLRSMGGVGASVEWVLDRFWPELAERSAQYDAFNRAAAAVPPGANGVIFTPLSGGHLETGAPANRGITGLLLHHSRADIARALMEGIGLELCWMLEEMSDAVEITTLCMIGGAGRSPVWPQIVADITRLPLEVLQVSEAAGLGAAILAGIGAGIFKDAESTLASFQIPGRPVIPEPGLDEFYHGLNNRYRRLWALVPHDEEVQSSLWAGGS